MCILYEPKETTFCKKLMQKLDFCLFKHWGEQNKGSIGKKEVLKGEKTVIIAGDTNIARFGNKLILW